ncbi:MAG: transposase [Kofleriaceae bacterium]
MLEELTHIGVDELSCRRHHHERHGRRRPPRRSGSSGPRRARTRPRSRPSSTNSSPARVAKLEAVTIDMSAAYIKAVTEASPHAQIIFDRFHVQRLAHDALDEVRRAEVHDTATPADRKALKGTRWPLLRRAWNLRGLEICKLATLTRTSQPPAVPCLPAQGVARGHPRRQAQVTSPGATRRVDRLGGQVATRPVSPRGPHDPRAHQDGILACVRSRLSNGRTEALAARPARSRAAPTACTAPPRSSPY